jgi:hypothetical protein
MGGVGAKLRHLGERERVAVPIKSGRLSLPHRPSHGLKDAAGERSNIRFPLIAFYGILATIEWNSCRSEERVMENGKKRYNES